MPNTMQPDIIISFDLDSNQSSHRAPRQVWESDYILSMCVQIYTTALKKDGNHTLGTNEIKFWIFNAQKLHISGSKQMAVRAM